MAKATGKHEYSVDFMTVTEAEDCLRIMKLFCGKRPKMALHKREKKASPTKRPRTESATSTRPRVVLGIPRSEQPWKEWQEEQEKICEKSKAECFAEQQKKEKERMIEIMKECREMLNKSVRDTKMKDNNTTDDKKFLLARVFMS